MLGLECGYSCYPPDNNARILEDLSIAIDSA